MVFVQNLLPTYVNSDVQNDQHQTANASQNQRRGSPENLPYFKPGYIPHDEIRYVHYSKRMNSISEDEEQTENEENIRKPTKNMTGIKEAEDQNYNGNMQRQDGQDIQNQTKGIEEEDDIQNISKNMTGEEPSNTEKNPTEYMKDIPQDATSVGQSIRNRSKSISFDDGQNNKENIHNQSEGFSNITEDETPNGQDVQNGAKSISEYGKNGKGGDVDYDELLSSAGEFGWYQMFLFMSTFPFYWFGAFAYFSQLFMTEVSPNHWCWVPELANLTDVERRSLAIPPEDSPFGYSRCRQYAVSNWSEVLSQHLTANTSWETKACDQGWEFNLTEIPYPTAASELSWVCERDSYQATAQSVFFVGSIVGGFLVGWIADRFGRVPAAVSSNLAGCAAGVASVFSTDFAQFAASRFFLGMAYDNCMMMTYLLVVEYVAPKYRSLIANLPFAIFFTSGLVALPWIALACGHWRTLGLATSVPMALALLAPFIIPESPRWLLSKGRVEDAIQRVQSIGRVNKKPVPTTLIEKFRISTIKNPEDKSSSSILEVLKRPILRKVLICMCVVYMCCMIVFDSLVRSIGQLKFDFFLSFTVVSLTEFPSLILVSFILDISGRKLLTLITFSVSCIFSLLTAFVSSGLPSVLCAMAARFSINMACNTSMQWAAECLPTPVRGSGYSIVHICGYVATVISPFIVYLGVYVEWLPLVIVSLVAALGALVALGLPETAGRDMPQTFEDAETMVKSQGLLELPRRKVKGQGHVNESYKITES